MFYCIVNSILPYSQLYYTIYKGEQQRAADGDPLLDEFDHSVLLYSQLCFNN